MKHNIFSRNLFVARFVLLVTAVLLASGCAVGNKYRYEAADVGLPIKSTGNESLGVGTEDARPYVLSGDKPATFVGLQRGGFGNPFDVNTQSNQPFGNDAANVLSTMLNRANYETPISAAFSTREDFVSELQQKGLEKGAYLLIREWKTDIYMGISLHYDLELNVLNSDGEVLATSNQRGKEEIGGASMSQSSNGQSAALALSTKIAYLFNDPNIKDALN